MDRWDQLPGIQRNAQVMVAEVDADLKPFGAGAHLVLSLVKRDLHRPPRTCGQAAPWQDAQRQHEVCAVPWWKRSTVPRMKPCYFSARRLAARRGKKRARVAVRRILLRTGDYLIARQVNYQDLRNNDVAQHNQKVVKRRSSKRLERLGDHAESKPPTAPPAA